MTDYLERAYLRCIFHMPANAKAFVEIADFHYAQRLRHIGRQSPQIETLLSLSGRDIFSRDRQTTPDHFIDTVFNLPESILLRLCRKKIIEFALFLLYMGRNRPATAEHVDHHTVHYMLAGMHGSYGSLKKLGTRAIQIFFIIHKKHTIM